MFMKTVKNGLTSTDAIRSTFVPDLCRATIGPPGKVYGSDATTLTMITELDRRACLMFRRSACCGDRRESGRRTWARTRGLRDYRSFVRQRRWMSAGAGHGLDPVRRVRGRSLLFAGLAAALAAIQRRAGPRGKSAAGTPPEDRFGAVL